MAEWVNVGEWCFNMDQIVAVRRRSKGDMLLWAQRAASDDYYELEQAEADALWRYMTETRTEREAQRLQDTTYYIYIPGEVADDD